MTRLVVHPRRVVPILCAAASLGAAVTPGAALAGSGPDSARPPVVAIGRLAQLRGAAGCLVDRSKPARGCTRARALSGPAPFLGSNAVAVSRDGRNVYVAASNSDAIAVFRRNARTGALTQRSGSAGCIAARGAGGCARALALDGPNSVAVSADGKNVYATSLTSDSIETFRRNPSTGALTQAVDGSACLAGRALPGCTAGRAIDGPDVVAVSPGGTNVYVGSFLGNAIVVLNRDASTGALTQPADTSGCLTGAPTSGCATGLALGSPEGMAVSADGHNVYVASATSNALDVLARDTSTGALTQASDGTGCITNGQLAGCATGTQLAGANAVAMGPDDGDVYVTSLMSNSVTSFSRAAGTGELTQKTGTSGCLIYLLAVGCSLGRALSAPEGIAASRDGATVYVTAFGSGAVDVLDRETNTGSLMQKPRSAGCLIVKSTPNCARARGLLGASSAAVGPNGRNVYVAAFKSNAVAVFRRTTLRDDAGG